MAAPLVVEAVRHLDLVRRLPDRIGWSPGIGWPNISAQIAWFLPRGGIRMNRPLRFLPLLILLAFVVAVAWRLSSPPDEKITSKMIGRPVPAFTLSPAVPGKPGLSSNELASGSPRMINVFASWCVPCITEAPLLAELKAKGIAIDAIAVRDRPEDVAQFLAQRGDPFVRIGADP